MPCRGPGGGLLGAGVEVPEGLPADQVPVIGKLHALLAAGSHTQPLQSAGLHHLAVAEQLPGKGELGQILCEALVVEVVAAEHPMPLLVLEVQRRLADFYLLGGGLLLQIGEHNAVEAHIRHGVNHVLPEGAGIAEGQRAVRLGLDQCLVVEVPQKAALEPGVFADQLPELGKVAVGVALGVGVLAHDEGALVVAAHAGLHPVPGGVHGAQDVADARQGAAGLVLHGAVVVELQPAVHGAVVGAHAGLVPQAPDDDAGVVLIPQAHVHGTGEVGLGPAGVIAEAAAIAVGLQVGFVHHVEAQLVAQVVEQVVLGIVAGAHGVEV